MTEGVNVAMITDSPILSEESLYHHVGEAVREGLAQERAVRTVTINLCKSAGRRRPSGKPGRRKRCRYYCNERKTRT